MHCHPVSVGIQLPDTEHIDSSLVCLSKISIFFLKPDIWHLTLMGRELGSQPPLLAPGAHHFHHDPFHENGCPMFNTGEWGTQLWDPCKSCHRKAKCLCDYLYQQDPGFCPPYLYSFSRRYCWDTLRFLSVFIIIYLVTTLSHLEM